MISVVIYINNQSIVLRAARRIKGEPGELCHYKVDDGRTIAHHYDEGAVALAIKMLQGVKKP